MKQDFEELKKIAAPLVSHQHADVRTVAIVAYGLDRYIAEERDRACRIIRRVFAHEYAGDVEKLEAAIRSDET